MTALTVHAVLAGAYRGRKVSERALLTHASSDGGRTALCRRVQPDMLCDMVEDGPPTCPTCRARADRADRVNINKATARSRR